MNGIDWPGLMRAGLVVLRLDPTVFWRLTPVELRLMLGIDNVAAPLTRARLEELAAAFPDGTRETGDGGYRSAGRSGGGAGGDAGWHDRDGHRL